MVIVNNASAGFILGTLNINLNKKNKASSQLALGEKIRNAGDDASGYAISEKMRVRLRALDQADANVQNGASMLRVAEGAIQSQINLLRTIKAKVIDAHNDTNTDADRQIIQKEITQYYNEINDIAAETTFNGKHLLLGNKVEDSVKSWYKLDHAEMLQDSDTLGLISGSIASLDGTQGPFNVFGASTDDVAWDGYNVKTLRTENMSGGDDGVSNTVSITFKDTLSPASMYDKAFMVKCNGTNEIFVLSNDGTKNYGPVGPNDHVTVIDVHNVSSSNEAIRRAAARVADVVQMTYRNTSGGTVISLTTNETGKKTNNTSLYNIERITLTGGSGYLPADSVTVYSSTGEVTIANAQSGRDGATAGWTWDLSAYNSTSTSVLDNFISQYVGQGITHSGNSKTYEFVDGGKYPSTDSITKLDGSVSVDLNQLRSAVASGTTVAEAFTNLLRSRIGSDLVTAVTNTLGQVTGVRINATVAGSAGNSQKISFKKADLRDYTIDFKSFFSSQGISGGDIAAKLDGKGFRVYDATDANKWVNVLFVNGLSDDDYDRPASGTKSLDIDTLVVDVSNISDVGTLIKTLYEGDDDKNPVGLAQYLENSSQNFRLAADYNAGTITFYDNRKYYVYEGQTEKGAKIGDGIMDNVVNDYRNTYVNDLVIQHTDRSSANIHVKIPQTTMDQIFGYKIGAASLDDFSVLTSEKREMLLGQDYPTKIRGTLDKGLQYLIDANTLIGAQINHMENADANIVTELENTMAAESTIRDADIAKSAMDKATADILSQSTMAMLSQFNHSSSDVLNLLQ